MVKAGIVNRGVPIFLLAVKIEFFRDFACKNAIQKVR